MTEPYNGKCPICRSILGVDVAKGRFFICPNGDFEISYEDWFNRWTQYEEKVRIAANQLLQDLKDANSKKVVE